MSGYSRSCSRADSSILLVAQCAAALSIMPASAPSCWMQGVTAASYKEYDILGLSPSGGLYGKDHKGSVVLPPRVPRHTNSGAAYRSGGCRGGIQTRPLFDF